MFLNVHGSKKITITNIDGSVNLCKSLAVHFFYLVKANQAAFDNLVIKYSFTHIATQVQAPNIDARHVN